MIARQIERLEAGHKLEHVVEASGAIERSSTPVRHRRDAAGHIGTPPARSCTYNSAASTPRS